MDPYLLINVFTICVVAGFAGVMLSIGLILGSYWRSLPPAAFVDWFSANAHLIARRIPKMIIPALFGLGASLYVGWGIAESRGLWLGATACFLAIIGITVVFHLPVNASFVSKTVSLDEVPAVLNRWLRLHALRTLLGFGSAALAVLATLA